MPTPRKNDRQQQSLWWRLIISMVAAALIGWLGGKQAYAAEIAVDLTVTSLNQKVTATINNRSNQPVRLDTFHLGLNRQRYLVFTTDTLAAHSEKTYQINVEMPPLQGSYLLDSRFTYHNGQHRVGLQNVSLFYVGERHDLPASCQLKGTTLKKNQPRLKLLADGQFDWRLFLPDGLEPIQRLDSQNTHLYWLKPAASELVNRYTVYAGAERVVAGRHEAALCSASLAVDGQFGNYLRGKLSGIVLYSITALSFTGVLLIGANTTYEKKLAPYGCYLARLALLGGAYVVLRHAPLWLDSLNNTWTLNDPPVWITLLSDHFWGDNYRFFFDYFADTYFLVYLAVGLPYFLFVNRPDTLANDKYCALLASIFSLYKLCFFQCPLWHKLSRLGLLTVTVKFFFLPYMASWSIQNIKHIGYLFTQDVIDFYAVNDGLQTFFMLMDTGIFAFGYLFESRRLGSEIKSVDASWSGWLVCLLCYPPFNAFSFPPFDYAIVPIHLDTPPAFQMVITAAITALWGMFTLASVNLGFKASNLTNRGIVAHGLYRYVRHPAYSIKALIWIIQGVFFGYYTSGILLAFICVYVLRALTEERHLSQDPDYIAYRQQVPWRFIPKVG